VLSGPASLVQDSRLLRNHPVEVIHRRNESMLLIFNPIRTLAHDDASRVEIIRYIDDYPPPRARDVDVDVGHRDLSCFPLDADDGHLHHTFRRTHLDIGPVHVVLRPAPGVDINVDVWRDGGC
jgi:hypothetical protein